jgi:hypothetical protein
VLEIFFEKSLSFVGRLSFGKSLSFGAVGLGGCGVSSFCTPSTSGPTPVFSPLNVPQSLGRSLSNLLKCRLGLRGVVG